MISDAYVTVTCDNNCCAATTEIMLPYKYDDYSGKGGSPNDSIEVIERLLLKHGWVIRGEKQYCCCDCA